MLFEDVVVHIYQYESTAGNEISTRGSQREVNYPLPCKS